MKFSLAAFKKLHIPEKKVGAATNGRVRRTVILASAGTLVFLLGVLLSFDAYLFYLTQWAPMESPLPDSKKTLRPEDIDETIGFLDQRAEAFQAIASSTAPH